MEKIVPIIWIVGTLAVYAAVWRILTYAIGALRRRSGIPEFLGILIVLVASGWLPAPWPWRLLVIAAVGAALAMLYGRFREPKATTGPEARSRKEDRRQAMLHLVLVSGGAIFIVPFVWLITTSLKEDDDIFKYPPTWIPTQQVQVKIGSANDGLAQVIATGQYVAEVHEKDASWIVHPYSMRSQSLVPGAKEFEIAKSDVRKVKHFDPRWQNYSDALEFLPPETLHGAMYLFNTLIVTMLNIFGVILSSSLVAFAFARLRWPGRDFLFLLMLSTMMLPAAVTLIPVFLIYRDLGWVDTLRPLWVGSFFAAPFNVFLLRQFFMTIPNDLEDAAKIDGCSYFRIYWNIMLPLIKPALAALTILAFMGSWNNFMGPLIYISSPEKMTLAYALQLFQSAHSSEYGMMMAASALVMMPVLVVFFFTQRYFIEGVTLTGIKG